MNTNCLGSGRRGDLVELVLSEAEGAPSPKLSFPFNHEEHEGHRDKFNYSDPGTLLFFVVSVLSVVKISGARIRTEFTEWDKI